MAGWRPNPGDTITGIVKYVALSAPNRYGQYPIVGLDNGTEIHAFHSVLRQRLSEFRPSRGDRLTVTYLGPVEGRENTYEKYEVDVEGKSPDIWGPTPTAATAVQPSGTSDIPADDPPF